MNYRQKRYLLLTLDPVHIGTGGYRLGRVDNTIAREPGTNLPKIPGTSLAGAVRSYAAMRYNKPDCAGQGQASDTRQAHCGAVTCPICYTFGFTKDNSGFAGTVSLSDAHLLFFPVYSMAGPVWVTTPPRVHEAGLVMTGDQPDDDKVTGSFSNRQEPLNLGWLMFEYGGDARINLPDPSPFTAAQLALWQAMTSRLVFTTEKLFSQIVNSNLEVRTSVSINPHTGAAEEHALFTYEAIPRASWLYFDVVEDDYRRDENGNSRFPATSRKNRLQVARNQQGEVTERKYHDNNGEALGKTWSSPLEVLEDGLELIRHLGVGGMGTRGFGRVQVAGAWQITGGAA